MVGLSSGSRRQRAARRVEGSESAEGWAGPFHLVGSYKQKNPRTQKRENGEINSVFSETNCEVIEFCPEVVDWDSWNSE